METAARPLLALWILLLEESLRLRQSWLWWKAVLPWSAGCGTWRGLNRFPVRLAHDEAGSRSFHLIAAARWRALVVSPSSARIK